MSDSQGCGEKCSMWWGYAIVLKNTAFDVSDKGWYAAIFGTDSQSPGSALF